MEISEADFEERVLRAERPVLVDFWASWCPPCKMMQPVVDKLAKEVADQADVVSLNIDRSPALAARFNVSGVPTFISFADGEAVGRKTGALTAGQLKGLIGEAADRLSESADPEDAADGSITVVSGLPRSGTSLMMKMLEAGGIPAMCDEERTADEDNPNGYYEFEDVKSLAENTDWIPRARGRSVKMVYRLLQHLPTSRSYHVLVMRRETEEILQSQKKMLERQGITTDIPDEQMRRMFDRELRQFYEWLPAQSHLKPINVSYNELMRNPAAVVQQINAHLGGQLNTTAMEAVIDPGLYRNRAA